MCSSLVRRRRGRPRLARVDRERVLVLRYWQLVSQPVATLNRVAGFLGIAEDQITTVPPDNSRRFVAPGLRTSVIGRAIRAGAAAGRLFPPQVWRQASGPLLAALQFRGPKQRPKLAVEQRSTLLGDCADDIALSEAVLGDSFQDWHSATGRGSFVDRVEASGQR